MQPPTDDELTSLLIDYADGQLDAEAAAQVAQWLAADPGLRAQLAQLQTVLGELQPPAPLVPGPELGQQFYAALAHAKAAQNPPARVVRLLARPWQWAAAAAVFVLAFGLGRWSTQPQQQTTEHKVARLEQEMAATKQAVMLAMLKQESASGRIQAVNYARELDQADQAVTEALLNTLNYDPNANVRLAAVEALARFGDNAPLRQAVALALARQTEPLVQIALIDVLIGWREQSALSPLQKLMVQPDAPEAVRAKAAEGVGAIYQL
ncbi:MAG: hypothetical protein MUC97_04410 [Bernardetiaceae bacterium]|jgi:hypothetical protein|nr:hypothetical protein [Bernardetiaceae bacterium]